MSDIVRLNKRLFDVNLKLEDIISLYIGIKDHPDLFTSYHENDVKTLDEIIDLLQKTASISNDLNRRMVMTMPLNDMKDFVFSVFDSAKRREYR